MQQADDNENAERFDTLPQTLGQAITAFIKDPLVKKVLGDDVYAKFLEAKESEWKRFRSCVTQWEMNEYLGKY
jgi:glutamine synthetase